MTNDEPLDERTKLYLTIMKHNGMANFAVSNWAAIAADMGMSVATVKMTTHQRYVVSHRFYKDVEKYREATKDGPSTRTHPAARAGPTSRAGRSARPNDADSAGSSAPAAHAAPVPPPKHWQHSNALGITKETLAKERAEKAKKPSIFETHTHEEVRQMFEREANEEWARQGIKFVD
ncbi:hypothetical protein PG990_013210 [Apiospora arundinis]